MKPRYYLPSVALLLALALPLQVDAQTFLTARLSADQAGVETEGTPGGTAAMVLTEEGLRYFVTVDGLSGDIQAAHFHTGAYGESGGVIHPVEFQGTRASGMWSRSGAGGLTDELLQELLTGQLYLNVHTAANAAGEIRGQVLPSSGASLTAALTPEAETHDVESDGSGTAALTLTDEGLIYYVSVADLTGSVAAAHFHIGAPGVSGGVVHGIEFDDHSSFGIWRPGDAQPLVDSLLIHLLTGNLYLNAHTESYPAGEIRGQVELSGGIGFEARLNAENETGEVDSPGMGTGTFTLTDAGLVYNITVSGLTGAVAAAHFHQAPAGVDGGVVHPITFTGNSASGVWRTTGAGALSRELIQELLAGNLYVNVHTAQYGAGEIRGQVLLDEGTHLSARLSDAQSGTETGGAGTGAMSLTDAGLAYQITIDGLSGGVAAAHFHTGAMGEDGGVIHGITFDGTTASGVWDRSEISDETLVTLLTGGLYVNVHTESHAAGEIRGQVVPASGAGLMAPLTNAQSGTNVETAGGTATMTLTDAGLIYRATVGGLSGDIAAAHFHDAQPGANGGVAHGVSFSGGTTQGVWLPGDAQPLTDARVEEIVTGGIYLNVHTADNPAGEIRGQLELSGGFGRAVEMGPESSEVQTSGYGTASTTLTGAGLAYRATVSNLTGDISAAHFHRAPLGQGGGVVRGVSFDGVHTAGVWRPSDDETLDVSALQAFFADELYLNVHTMVNPSGEVRGQLDLMYDAAGTSRESDSEMPGAFKVGQNYPNPFNPQTTIPLEVDREGYVRLDVFDALGRRVATPLASHLTSGTYEVSFDARFLPAGVYFYRINRGPGAEVRAMTVLP